MKRNVVAALAACAMTLAAPFATAADAPPAQPSAAKPPAAAASGAILIDEIEPQKSRFPEPAVQHTVIEDRGTRIDELRVRGQLQKVTVSPKGGAPEYEVLTQTDGTRVFVSETGQSPGSSGKRVWKVLRF
jgi:hypothetical protein